LREFRMSVFTDIHTLSVGFSGVSNAGGCAAVTFAAKASAVA